MLTTERLILVPLTEEHLPFEIELDADPDVMRYLFAGKPRTADEVRESHARRVRVAADAPGLGLWVGMVDGRPAGWWLLEPPQRDDGDVSGPRAGQAELGYRLLPCYWRRGLAVEGSRALLRHCFTGLRLDRVFAETMAVNVRSRATMARLGMTHVRTFHVELDEPIDGWQQGEVEYAITRDEWLAATPR